MIQQKEFLYEMKSNKIKNVYLFCGMDENIIKEDIELIKNTVLNNEFKELNYNQYDGIKVTEDDILNACETMPFMDERKVVVIYRADFLIDKEKEKKETKSRISKKENDQPYKFVKEYIEKVPNHCILIMYYLFKANRDKPSNRIKNLEGKNACLVKIDKLRGSELTNKVKGLFEAKGVDIGKTELILFCNEVENNMDIIENEIDKLCSYTQGRSISKNDIYDMMPYKSENDVFNLVEYISQNNVKKSIDALNELSFRGEKITGILRMIQRQYKLLYDIKIRLSNGMAKDKITLDLKLNPYICEKMISQSKSFSEECLKIMINECLECEKRLKTSSSDPKIDLELLIVKGVTLRRNT